MTRNVRTIIAVLLAVIGATAAAREADETTGKVDKIFAAWDKTTSPGAALAVIRDGKIIYERGYGMAKLEDGIAITPDKVFDIGSVSKQFTAACVAMLVREGKVGLDEDIRTYIPEMPAYEKPVTVRHLLHHTSGLRDYNGLLALAGFREDADSPTVEEALEIIRRQKKLNYLPGEEFSYTNTGYFLLSQIVERVSGKSINAFAQERIFKPLGMTETLFQDDHTQIIKDRATGYSRGAKGFTISMSNWDETGDGNVYTTARDLFLWDQAFYTNALGKDVMDLLHTTGALNSGQKIDYAFGLFVREYKGLRIVEHGGAWVGFRAMILRFPEQKFSVVILANLDAINPSQLAYRVADIYLAGLLQEPTKDVTLKAPAMAVPKAELEALTGNWQDRQFGQWLVVAMKNDRLVATLGGRTFSFVAVGPGKFMVPDNPAGIEIEFSFADPSQARQARMTVGSGQEFRFAKTVPVKALSPEELREYEGTYVSEELLDAKYRIRAEKDRLVIQARTLSGGILKAMAPDKFTVAEFGLNIEFVREPGRKIAGFTVSIGRAAGIEFVKK